MQFKSNAAVVKLLLYRSLLFFFSCLSKLIGNNVGSLEMQSSEELPANFDNRFLEVHIFTNQTFQSSKKLSRFITNMFFFLYETRPIFLKLYCYNNWLVVKWITGLPRGWRWRPRPTFWRDGPNWTADHSRHAQYPGCVGTGEYLKAHLQVPLLQWFTTGWPSTCICRSSETNSLWMFSIQINRLDRNMGLVNDSNH